MLCGIVGVSRAGYYKWLKRIPTDQEIENNDLVEKMKILQRDNKNVLGYRRMADELYVEHDIVVNRKRVYRLMKLESMQSIIRRKRKSYPRSNPQHIAENILNREFVAERPNQKWLTDVTEFKYGNGKKAYLSAIIDLYDNSIVSYVVGHSNNNDLVFKTFDPVLPLAINKELLIHSDRGYQYTSHGFHERIEANKNIIQSMSRVGRCIDNGPIEGFWSHLKCEMYYLEKFDTYDDLKYKICGYINHYNYKRIQSKLNRQSPMEYRTMAA